MRKESRSPERLRHHYEVEKELAQRLLRSSREQRPQLYRTLYDELFARVPDHPRLTRRATEESSRRAVATRMALLRGQLAGVKTFLEFAPGDCRLALEMCRHVDKVYAVDISDQTGGQNPVAANFELILYDGYHLNLPDHSVDLAFSYQFIEHLHPDDAEGHFEMVKRVLKPGGAYLFSTPHRFSGSHDISEHFSEVPQGFHLKEWTYREMCGLLGQTGFAAWHGFRFGQPRMSPWVGRCNLALESVVERLPSKIRRRISARLFESVIMMART